MNLSNYSFETCLEQFLENTADNAELLRRAVELRGIDETRAFLVGRGLASSTVTVAFRAIGVLPPLPPPQRHRAGPLETLARSLRRDLPRLSPTERRVVLDIIVAYEKENPVVVAP